MFGYEVVHLYKFSIYKNYEGIFSEKFPLNFWEG